MNDNIFFKFLQVIEAARTGRFMFGNGRYWYIIEAGRKVCIDTMLDTMVETPSYEGVANKDMGVVSSLTRFLMVQDGASTTSQWGYYDVLAEVKSAVNDDRLLFTNGHQWYCLREDGKTVFVGELGVKAHKVNLTVFGALASWQYRQENGGFRAKISDSTRKYMNF